MLLQFTFAAIMMIFVAAGGSTPTLSMHRRATTITTAFK
jgi:hypothetical protein